MKHFLSISVVLVTFERSPSILKRALDGVFAQTYAVSKIIIADMNTDSSISSAISDYIGLIDRSDVELIRLPGRPNNHGRNRGASLTESDYIAFLDDDDEWSPRKLESQMDIMGENVSMVYSNYEIEGEKGDNTQFFDKTPEIDDIKTKILGENVVGCTSIPLLSIKAFHEAGGFDESFKANQDWDLWIRILQNGDAKYCPEIAGIKHSSKESISNSRRRRTDGWIRLLMKHAKLYRKNPNQFAKATGFFGGEMFNKKMYLTGAVAFITHAVFRAICRDI